MFLYRKRSFAKETFKIYPLLVRKINLLWLGSCSYLAYSNYYLLKQCNEKEYCESGYSNTENEFHFDELKIRINSFELEYITNDVDETCAKL